MVLFPFKFLEINLPDNMQKTKEREGVSFKQPPEREINVSVPSPVLVNSSVLHEFSPCVSLCWCQSYSAENQSHLAHGKSPALPQLI